MDKKKLCLKITTSQRERFMKIEEIKLEEIAIELSQNNYLSKREVYLMVLR